MCPVAGDILVAPCLTQGFRVVGCPTWVQWFPLHKLPSPYWCFWLKGFPGYEEGEDLCLSPGAASLCQRLCGPNRCFLQVSMRILKVHGPPDDPQWWWHCWGLPLKPMGDKHGTPPTPEEETVLLGEEIKLPPVPDSSAEPAKWGTTPSASSPSPFSNLLSFPKGRRVLEGNWCCTK